jgi:hypothetical protein
MKRTIFELVLVIGLAVAGWMAWTQGKASGSASGQLKELTEQKSELQDKLVAAEKQLTEQAEQIKAMGPKAQQFDAAQGALSGGQVLEDLEKLYAGNKKGLSNEQQLGLGVVRLLSKGPQDQGALQALNKTLEQIDWSRNQKIICATQNALAAAGKDVKVLAECSKKVSLAEATSPATAASQPAAAASEAASADKPAPAKDKKSAKKP